MSRKYAQLCCASLLDCDCCDAYVRMTDVVGHNIVRQPVAFTFLPLEFGVEFPYGSSWLGKC